MGTSSDNVKGWLGVVFSAWPIVRLLLSAFGVDLPDFGGLGDFGAAASGAIGVNLLAKSDAIAGDKSEKSRYI